MTSHTTKAWPTEKWLCDIEPAIAIRVKGAVKDKIIAADGHLPDYPPPMPETEKSYITLV